MTQTATNRAKAFDTESERERQNEEDLTRKVKEKDKMRKTAIELGESKDKYEMGLT